MLWLHYILVKVVFQRDLVQFIVYSSLKSSSVIVEVKIGNFASLFELAMKMIEVRVFWCLTGRVCWVNNGQDSIQVLALK